MFEIVVAVRQAVEKSWIFSKEKFHFAYIIAPVKCPLPKTSSILLSPSHVAHYAQLNTNHKMYLLFILIFLKLSVYVQLYIQESVTLGNKMPTELARSSRSRIPQITWAPVSATGIVQT